jgi:hypothetical protein
MNNALEIVAAHAATLGSKPTESQSAVLGRFLPPFAFSPSDFLRRAASGW